MARELLRSNRSLVRQILQRASTKQRQDVPSLTFRLFVYCNVGSMGSMPTAGQRAFKGIESFTIKLRAPLAPGAVKE